MRLSHKKSARITRAAKNKRIASLIVPERSLVSKTNFHDIIFEEITPAMQMKERNSAYKFFTL